MTILIDSLKTSSTKPIGIGYPLPNTAQEKAAQTQIWYFGGS